MTWEDILKQSSEIETETTYALEQFRRANATEFMFSVGDKYNTGKREIDSSYYVNTNRMGNDLANIMKRVEKIFQRSGYETNLQVGPQSAYISMTKR